MNYRRTIDPTALPISLTEAKAHLRIEDSDASEDALLTALIRAATDYVEEWTGRALVASTYALKLNAFPGDEILLPRAPLIAVSAIAYTDVAGAAQTVATTDYTTYLTALPHRIGLAYGCSWPTARDIRDSVTVTFTAGYGIPFSVAAATEILTLSGASSPGDTTRVRLSNVGGALPMPLATLTDYFIRDTSAATCKLAAASGGAAIDITSAGTGTHFLGEIPADIIAALKLLISDLYENREITITGTIVEELPTVKRLLSLYRIVELG